MSTYVYYLLSGGSAVNHFGTITFPAQAFLIAALVANPNIFFDLFKGLNYVGTPTVTVESDSNVTVGFEYFVIVGQTLSKVTISLP